MADAFTIRGTKTPLKFSTTTTTGYIVDEEGLDQESENVALDDEEGNFVIDIAGWGEQHRRRIKVIPLDTAVAPALGDVLTYGDSLKMVVDRISKVQIKKDVERWDIEGHSHPGITLV